jgi:hypothetical protein
MDEVHGRGLRIEGAQAQVVLAYYQGDTFTFICEWLGDGVALNVAERLSSRLNYGLKAEYPASAVPEQCG